MLVSRVRCAQVEGIVQEASECRGDFAGMGQERCVPGVFDHAESRAWRQCGRSLHRARIDQAIAAPGHTADSICLLATFGTERCVCSGDTILGRGTTVVSWPDGNLADYLVTLDKLSALDGVPVLTGHGPIRPDCGQIAREYRAHRDERLVQVRAALAAGAQTPSDIVDHVYPDLEAALRPAAESTV